tara:strand:+ start:307 stop:783 length:477 start_codon:yes stop_codon:yes gene_type:complete
MFLKEYKIKDLDYINVLKEEIINNIDKNISYNTNVKGKMTNWKYFTHHSKNFDKIRQVLYEYHIYEAWGNILNKGDFVKEHDHLGKNKNMNVSASGVLYLTDVGLGTYFKEFDVEVKSEVGKIIIFDPSYRHSVKEYDKEEDRVTLAFNGRVKEAYEF